MVWEYLIQQNIQSLNLRPKTNEILQGDVSYSYDIMAGQISGKAEATSMKKTHSKEVATTLKDNLNVSLKRAMELAQEKGVSSWLTALPIQEHGFTLHKSAFWDALALRYDWIPSHLPSSCACGTCFSVEHALSSPKGGFPSLRHNEIRDMTANLLTEICSDVCVEPQLQPLSGESLNNCTANTDDHVCLDIAANGLWGGRYERTFMDVHVFNPMHILSSRPHSPQCIEHMKEGRREQFNRECLRLSMPPLPQ